MNKTLLAVSLVACVLASTACMAGSKAGNMDNAIEASAKNTHVFKTILKEDTIHVKSKDGIVTLTGSVAQTFHKSLAKEAVSELPGVKSVENNLEVKDASVEGTDTWLAGKVKITLMFHRNINGVKTDVDVKDRVATLRGIAASQAQKELATELCKDIDGIKDVKNEMTVSEPTEAESRTTGEKIDDASISAQVRLALLLHRSTSVLKTHVSAVNGVVTLSGDAKNGAEKDLATKLVKGINGVDDVKNDMKIN